MSYKATKPGSVYPVSEAYVAKECTQTPCVCVVVCCSVCVYMLYAVVFVCVCVLYAVVFVCICCML